MVFAAASRSVISDELSDAMSKRRAQPGDANSPPRPRSSRQILSATTNLDGVYDA
jgi:hypothetical protein